jgi:hypothetical protein
MVELMPFEKATNRTSMLILTQGQTKFPAKCYSWTKLKGESIDSSLPLSSVLPIVEKEQMIIKPIDNNPESPWLMAKRNTVSSAKNMMGSSLYKAHEGIVTALNGAFWVEILSKHG